MSRYCFSTAFSLSAAGFLGTLGLPVATAQEAPAEAVSVNGELQSRSSFEAAYFAPYAPRTALDMIRNVPGFQLVEQDRRRGLGQGGANILVNGRLLSNKTRSEDQLGRIAANKVVRIEVKDGASLNIPGLSGQVADVIVEGGSGISGTWNWEPEFFSRIEPNLAKGEASLSGQAGALGYVLAIRSRSQRQNLTGPERVFDAAGELFEIRHETYDNYIDRPGASIDLSWAPLPGHTGNLGFEYKTSDAVAIERSRRTAVTSRGQDLVSIASAAEDNEWNTTLSADYALPLAGGTMKLIGYNRFQRKPTIDKLDRYDASGLIESRRFFQNAEEGERIGRAEYSWVPGAGRDWQVAGEFAFNFLDIDNLQTSLSGADQRNSARVEERRSELTVTHSRVVTDKWALQTSLGAEYSELSQTTGNVKRDFVRPKGFVSATYEPYDGLALRARIKREVGQLEFRDFVNSVSLIDGLNNTGNSELVPEQSWVGELEYDKDYGQGNSLKVLLYGQMITDIVDRIPVGTNGDAVGNIDEGRRYGVDINVDLKGERWGFNGTQVELALSLSKSEVDDPLLGFSRPLNGDQEHFLTVRFRHDIPQTEWAYGIGAEKFDNAEIYRLNTVEDLSEPIAKAYVYLENKDVFGIKLRATVDYAFDHDQQLYRDYYTDRRDIGVLDFTESYKRNYGPFLRISASGTF